MSLETFVMIGALGATIAANVMSALVLRSLALRLINSVMAYRPGRPTDPDPMPAADDGGHSPLQDVFQQYSKLTGRMADIIFQLTESRQGAREALLATARSIQEEASVTAAGLHALPAANPGPETLAQVQDDRPTTATKERS